MRTALRRSGAACFGAALLAGFAGCADSGADSNESASLRVGLAMPKLAIQLPLAMGYIRNALSQETLVITGIDGRPVPRIIESWQSSADGLTWTLRMRQGVRYHDGTALTAADLATQMNALKASSLGAVQDVRVREGSSDIVVTLREPYGFLMEDLAGIPVKRSDPTTKSVYATGPYRVEKESSEHVLLKAMPAHHRGDPVIDDIDVRLFPDQRNAWSALMRDQVDMIYEVSPESLEFVKSESSVKVTTFPRAFVQALGLNHAHPSLADPRVRRALDLAVDRDAIVRVALSGEGEPATGHIWPRHWAFDPATATVRQDLAQARALLDQAGLKLHTEPGRMPARLRLKCLVYQPLHKMALVVQRQLAAIDVDLELEMPGAEDLLQRLKTGSFESFIFEMTSGRTLKWPWRFWRADPEFFKHGYTAAEGVLDQMRKAPNEAAMRNAASALQRLFRENPPAVFLSWSRTSRAVSARFDLATDEEDVFHSIARWKLARPNQQ